MAGIWPLIATAAATMSAGIGRIETTIGPQMRPAERFSSCVRRDAEHPIRTQEGLGPVDHPGTTTWTKAVASSPSTSATSYRLSRYALTKTPRGLITSWSRVGVAERTGTSLSIMKLCTLRDRVEGPCPAGSKTLLAVLSCGSRLCVSTRWSAPGACGAENSVTSCDLQILVDQATEPVSSQRPNGRSHGGKCGLRAGTDVAIGADGASCEVGPGRGSGLSTGPFPRTACRTRRATFTATGSP